MKLNKLVQKVIKCQSSYKLKPFYSCVIDLVSGKITWEAVSKFYQKEIREELLENIVENLYSSPGQEGLTDQVLKSLEPNCACDCPQSCVTLSYHLETQSISSSQGIEDRSVTRNDTYQQLDYRESPQNNLQPIAIVTDQRIMKKFHITKAEKLTDW